MMRERAYALGGSQTGNREDAAVVDQRAAGGRRLVHGIIEGVGNSPSVVASARRYDSDDSDNEGLSQHHDRAQEGDVEVELS